jgi:2-keto-4-pentenoate hydratase/2-oxohepta-3-ene-1,7-dioic acid hydratase in catechol pathway
VGKELTRAGLLPEGATMIDLITRYDQLKEALAEAVANGTPVKLEPERLGPPVERPTKLWAAASNYKRGSSGLEDARGRGTAQDVAAEELLEAIFLKPPSAIIGPEGSILVSARAETIFPELELCVVIGKECRNLAKERALDAVFGYAIILDVTARGPRWKKDLVQTRCVRKGFDTFAPTGPWIVTRDEIPNPQDLALRLWVNGDLRQSARTDAMINGVADLVSYLSHVATLYPGDLIATGNPDDPAFQQELKPGDAVKVEIERIGAMNLRVAKED